MLKKINLCVRYIMQEQHEKEGKKGKSCVSVPCEQLIKKRSRFVQRFLM